MYQARIRMPRMGSSVHEGTVVAWKKAVGDNVSKGEIILSAESDKIEFEVESPADGVVLEILANAETTVAVGDVLAIIETQEEIREEELEMSEKSGPPKSEEWTAPIAPLPRKSEKTPIPSRHSNQAFSSSETNRHVMGGSWLSPRVQRLAAEHGLDLSTISSISGTGADGRITARDVERLIQEMESAPTVNISFGPIARDDKPEVRIPFSRVRKRIAENLTFSVREIPQVTTYLEVDMTRIKVWREANKGAFEKKHGAKLTFTPLFTIAIISALRDPKNARFNGSCENNELTIRRYVNLGVAVDSPEGLLVPVLHGADKLPFVDLVFRLEELSSKARSGALSPSDVKEGTITLTNFGISGVLFGNPIVNPPEVAIVGTGAIVPRVVSLPGEGMATRFIMNLAVTFDHRANDGLAAGRFASSIRTVLECMDFSQLEY